MGVTNQKTTGDAVATTVKRSSSANTVPVCLHEVPTTELVGGGGAEMSAGTAGPVRVNDSAGVILILIPAVRAFEPHGPRSLGAADIRAQHCLALVR